MDVVADGRGIECVIADAVRDGLIPADKEQAFRASLDRSFPGWGWNGKDGRGNEQANVA
jgi:hypothetical protein